jgi:hypothetical protein
LTCASQDFQVLRVNTRLSSVQCLTFRSCCGLCGAFNRLYPLPWPQNTLHDRCTVFWATATDNRRGGCFAGPPGTSRTRVRSDCGRTDQNVPPCRRSWRRDPDGRFRSFAPCGGTRGVPGQALEQGTRGCCSADLASDRMELPRRRDHVGIANSCCVGDRRAGRVAAPALNSRFCRIGCRYHAMIARLTTTATAIRESPPACGSTLRRVPPQPRPAA